MMWKTQQRVEADDGLECHMDRAMESKPKEDQMIEYDVYDDVMLN